MNADDCFSLLLSQRECSAIVLDIREATSKAGAARALIRHDLPEDDFVAGFPELAKWVQELPEEDPDESPSDP
ncbi:hypothetical protein STENM36S_01435 [Streptomyces tendae]